MRWQTYLLLAIAGLGTAWLASSFQTSPGYMDADYYFIGGRQLAEGAGFREAILWNFLDDPAGLPHPSHGYWMPLASLIAALGMALTGGADFAAASWPFLLIAAAVPPLTARLSWKLSGQARHAFLAGLLALFPGFYLAYLPTTETFGIYMLFGGLFMLLLTGGCTERPLSPEGRPSRLASPITPALSFLLGVLAGGMHLARADGLVWLGVAFVSLYILRPNRPKTEAAIPFVMALGLCLVGYLLVMGPWMLRNLAVFGAPLAPGGSRALWLTDYDELFIYPASLLTPARLWANGLGALLQSRMWALGLNLQSGLAVQGQIFLAPLALIGLWRYRRSPAVQGGILAWLLTLAAMTVVFPFQGARGGFFHSGAAVQPLLWAVAPAGLDAMIEWGGRTRGWYIPQARRVFGVGLVLLALTLTVFLTVSRISGGSDDNSDWNAGWRRYAAVEAALQAYGAPPQAVVLANNAPGFHAVSRRPAISIPLGDRPAVLEVAGRYDAKYLLMELDQVQGETLFSRPGDRPGLRYLGEQAEVQIYEILAP